MRIDPQRFLDMGRQVLTSQPFSVLLGAAMPALEPRRCDVFSVADGQEKLCAIAQGTIVKLPEVANEAEK
jgi:hypothetical protein